jgi:hypothetical protein
MVNECKWYFNILYDIHIQIQHCKSSPFF